MQSQVRSTPICRAATEDSRRKKSSYTLGAAHTLSPSTTTTTTETTLKARDELHIPLYNTPTIRTSGQTHLHPSRTRVAQRHSNQPPHPQHAHPLQPPAHAPRRARDAPLGRRPQRWLRRRARPAQARTRPSGTRPARGRHRLPRARVPHRLRDRPPRRLRRLRRLRRGERRGLRRAAAHRRAHLRPPAQAPATRARGARRGEAPAATATAAGVPGLGESRARARRRYPRRFCRPFRPPARRAPPPIRCYPGALRRGRRAAPAPAVQVGLRTRPPQPDPPRPPTPPHDLARRDPRRPARGTRRARSVPRGGGRGVAPPLHVPPLRAPRGLPRARRAPQAVRDGHRRRDEPMARRGQPQALRAQAPRARGVGGANVRARVRDVDDYQVGGARACAAVRDAAGGARGLSQGGVPGQGRQEANAQRGV